MLVTQLEKDLTEVPAVSCLFMLPAALVELKEDLLITGGRSQSWSKQVILQNGKTRIEEHFS